MCVCVWGEADCWKDRYMPTPGETVESGNCLRHSFECTCVMFPVFDMILCKSVIFFGLDIPTYINSIMCVQRIAQPYSSFTNYFFLDLGA